MVTLNDDQQLFVLNHGNHYTCLGYSVCQERSQVYATWLASHNVPVPPEQPKGTLPAYERYQNLINLVQQVCKQKRICCEADLSPQLIGLEGKRVEVYDCNNQRRRFYVGRSTGSIPIHLEIKQRNSTGGSAVTGTPFKKVKVLY